jgi:hypothetical protein
MNGKSQSCIVHPREWVALCVCCRPLFIQKRDTCIAYHRSQASVCVCVCLAATVAINRVTRPFEKLSRRSRSRRATKTPWDHDLCPNFQRKVTASSSLAAFTSAPCMYRLFSLLLSPCLLFTAPTFCPGLRCTPRAGFEDGLFKLESETKHTDTGNQGKWVSVGKSCAVRIQRKDSESVMKL